jgi:hypothetical protein
MEQIFSEPQQFDLIMIGGQEAKFTQKNSIVMDFANYLGAFGFLSIGQVTMWEMFLVVFVKTKHVQHVKN